MSSLKNLAISGTIWTVAGFGMAQILRFGANLILTHLLAPEMFGLMALINVFIIGLNQFSDIGIGSSIIQNRHGDDPSFLNTAWTMQVIRSFLLWITCIIIAWPIAQFYGDLRLTWLIPLVGLAIIFDGFSSTTLFTLSRQISLGKLTLFELGLQIVSLAAMLLWAWFNPTIWALVIGNLVSGFLKMVWSYYLIPKTRNYFTWNTEFSQEIFAFSKWVLISTAMTFLATQADRLILGKLFSLEFLGVYNIATTLASLPQQIIYAVCGKIIFPVVSKQANLPRTTLRTKILQKRQLILLATLPLLAVFACFSDLVIVTLYDDRYWQAAWMLPILALGVWPHILAMTMFYVLLAIAKPSYGAGGFFLKFCYMLIGLPLAFYWGGAVGAIIIIAFNDIPLYVGVMYGLYKEKLTCFVQDLLTTLLLIGLIILILIGRHLAGFSFPLSQLI